MNRRYQVFVSSTYSDLKDERYEATWMLLQMDCIPAGMELFPAADEEQFQFIKKIIDDSDYYLLIIGGRYGSLTSDGKSYTEKEYDYAVEKGIKVAAFIHEAPSILAPEKQDTDPELLAKMNEFREKVQKSRIVKFWTKATDIPGLVASSFHSFIKLHPAKGWARGGIESPTKLLSEINSLRKENANLLRRLQSADHAEKFEICNIAGLDEEVTFSGKYSQTVYSGGRSVPRSYAWEVAISWRKLFAAISPFLAQFPNQGLVRSKVEGILFKLTRKEGYAATIDEQDFQTIVLQFKALNLITVKYSKATNGDMAWFWYLTTKGEHLMMTERVIRTKLEP